MAAKDPLHAHVDAIMAERKLDVLLLTGNTPENPNFWYLTKGQKLEAATLVYKRGGKQLLIAGDMERDCAAMTGLPWIPRSATPAMKIAAKAKKPGDYQLEWLSWVLKKVRAKGRVAIYGSGGIENQMSWLPRAKRAFKAIDCELVVEKSPALNAARDIKTEAEIEKIRYAGIGTKAAFDAIRRTIGACHAKGRTLHTSKGEPLTIAMLKSVADVAMAKNGLANVHGSIVAQGEEGGVPHNAGTNTRTVKTGLPIVCDIFPKDTASGYFFDMTRTFVPGKANPATKKAYEDVRQSTVLGYECYEPGLHFKELHDRVARFLAEKGYETLTTHPNTQVGFCHGLGHGLGLEVHEGPTLRSGELKPGMVITIEPGVYYPEKKLGIRIEDVAVVRDGYLENLTNYPTVLEVPLKGKAKK
jgi:Xaa-Pro aminopeptidase